MIRSLAILLAVAALPAAAESPYSAFADRRIKALSPQQVDELRQGRGMGLSLPAELNRHPGPAHVLELADRLELTAEQRTAVEVVRMRMTEQARHLGEEIIVAESALEATFATQRAEPAAVAAAAERLGALWGRLRGVHLVAHVAARDLLSPAQIDTYERLRGYGSGDGNGHHGHQRHG
jgi:hypothetical protein